MIKSDNQKNVMARLFQLLLENKKGAVGMFIITSLIIISLIAPLIAPHNPKKRTGQPHETASMEHPMGTTRMGKDVFSQLLYGGRISLSVGLFAGALTTIIAVIIGITAGYMGKKTDEALMFGTNLGLLIPALPLLIVISSFFEQASPMIIALVLALTGWPWSARVYRTQTLTLRNREFVMAAELMGEKKWRIILVQILPNMISLVASGFVGSTIFFILAEAGLEFIGLGDPASITWGTMLYWGQRSSALTVGAWWEIVYPSIMFMLTGCGLILINFTIDEITNPQLRTMRGMEQLKGLMSKKQLKRIYE